MTILTEGRRAGAFLVSPANNTRSFDTITVKSGENLVAGQLFQLDGTKAVAFTGAVDSLDELITEAAGIMWDNVDATDGDVEGATSIARDAEVNTSELTFPEEGSPSTGERARGIASLAKLGIICR